LRYVVFVGFVVLRITLLLLLFRCSVVYVHSVTLLRFAFGCWLMRCVTFGLRFSRLFLVAFASRCPWFPVCLLLVRSFQFALRLRFSFVTLLFVTFPTFVVLVAVTDVV
jgi:hypothetical protein